MRCEQTVEAGAYVLGALPPAERAAYERHVPTCPTCREEVAELAGLPGLLGRLDTATAAAIGKTESAPAAMLDTVLVSASTERRRLRQRHRWQRTGALLAAACLAGVVAFGAATMDHPTRIQPVVAALHPVSGAIPVSAVLAYVANDHGGTDITMNCVYPHGVTYPEKELLYLNLVVFPRGSTHGTTLSTWTVDAGDDLSFFWQVTMPPGQIGRIELQHEGAPLLVYEAT